MRRNSSDKWGSISGESLFPALLPFITLRQERFGALLFNPYLGMEVELDPLEAYFVGLCNDHNSCRQVEAEVQSHFGLTSEENNRRISDAASKLSRAFALRFHKGEESDRLSRPGRAEFSEDGPPLSAPKSVVWDVTYLCNLKCTHCLTNSGIPCNSELDTKGALHLIDRLADAKVLTLALSGGEPFMRPDIFELLNYISNTNMRMNIATNGLVMTDDMLHDIENLPVFEVQVSIDGIGEEHDIFRGQRGAFDAACQTISLLREVGIAVNISTTATSENLDSLVKIMDLALSMGCNGFKAIPFIPAGRGKANADRLKLDLPGHLRLCQTLVEKNRELRGRLSVSTDTCLSFLLGPEPIELLKNGHMGCSAGHDTLSIGADGTAYPCPFLHDFPLGNLIETPLKYIWEDSSILRTLRTLQKKDIGEPCKSCRYSPLVCMGGCRASAYLHYGDLNSPDPMCFKKLVA
jgi:radical SAM protein with 4Fe4S-binding SPASM domain